MITLGLRDNDWQVDLKQNPGIAAPKIINYTLIYFMYILLLLVPTTRKREEREREGGKGYELCVDARFARSSCWVLTASGFSVSNRPWPGLVSLFANLFTAMIPPIRITDAVKALTFSLPGNLLTRFVSPLANAAILENCAQLSRRRRRRRRHHRHHTRTRTRTHAHTQPNNQINK